MQCANARKRTLFRVLAVHQLELPLERLDERLLNLGIDEHVVYTDQGQEQIVKQCEREHNLVYTGQEQEV